MSETTAAPVAPPAPAPAAAPTAAPAPVAPGKKYKIGVIPFLNVQPLL